ncbi:unnamed protein product [Linum trigynum]|uniref:Uncharacterized protein n=1 Tax=Linum trigynum TaxID=586398 RepID=A0AAV2E283_9ROSI
MAVVVMMVVLLLHTLMIIISTILIVSAAGALNPMCGSDEFVYCSSAGDFADGVTQRAVMEEIIMLPFC